MTRGAMPSLSALLTEVRACRLCADHVPMGFCFPATGKSGDLPLRPECAPVWRAKLLSHLKKLQLTLVIERYAQDYHLPNEAASVTEVVQAWRKHWPHIVPLPHPSPRNIRWLKRNPWFEEELIGGLPCQTKGSLRLWVPPVPKVADWCARSWATRAEVSPRGQLPGTSIPRKPGYLQIPVRR